MTAIGESVEALEKRGIILCDACGGTCAKASSFLLYEEWHVEGIARICPDCYAIVSGKIATLKLFASKMVRSLFARFVRVRFRARRGGGPK